jgi:copper transport protein
MFYRSMSALVFMPLLGLTQAFGHSGLAMSVPTNGASLTATPPQLELKFNTPVQVMTTQLHDASGKDFALPPPDMRTGVTDYSADLPALAAGTYILEWRALSDDGHGIGGKITFSIGQ